MGQQPLTYNYGNAVGNTSNTANNRNTSVFGNGNSFDVFAAGQQEALARQEQAARRQTAAQIHQAGFAGTPLGVMAGKGADNLIAQNRTAHALELGAMRPEWEQREFEYTQDRRNAAGDNFSQYLSVNPLLADRIREGDTSVIMSDPGMQQALRDWHIASGGNGNFDTEWAVNAVNNHAIISREHEAIIYSLMCMGLSREEAEEWYLQIMRNILTDQGNENLTDAILGVGGESASNDTSSSTSAEPPRNSGRFVAPPVRRDRDETT